MEKHTHIHLHLPRKTRDAVAHDPKNGQFTAGSGGGGGAAKPAASSSKTTGKHEKRMPVGSQALWNDGNPVGKRKVAKSRR